MENTMTALPDSLTARLRISQLLAEYAQCLDADQLETWHDFFTQDAVYKVTTRENQERGLPLSLIYCRGHGMMKDRISALRTANIFEPHVYCHLDGALVVGKDSDGAYTARSNFTILRTMTGGDMSVFACGRFFDRIVEVDGVLKFAERIAVLDSRQIDTLLVIPI
jgi:anthranilate 1,2-dioxygenase small subunit